MAARIELPSEQIRDFCRRWKIAEFSLFGSVLRDDFRPESDVDILVTFDKMADHDLYAWIDMRDELAALFGRPVHLTSEKGLRNPFRRREILGTREVIYAA